MFRVGILTVSDRGSTGERADLSGPAVRALLPPASFEVERYQVVADERPEIEACLRDWADRQQLDLILTTGGTGLSPRDVTPDATLAVLERSVPGLAEVMRAESLKKTPLAMVSRAVAGTRGRSLIVNLPGSPKGATECLDAILPALPHALEKLQGDPSDCAPPERGS